MKPLFIFLTIVTTAFSSASFANSTNTPNPKPVEPRVAPSVIKSFNKTFTAAQEADWTVSKDFYKVEFAMSGQYVTAFYGTDGQLLGVTRNISSLQLPLTLQAELKKGYQDLWITDLFEVANNEGTSYYVTLENSETKIILKGTASSSWSTYQKSRKA
jgi:hypothetical protein